MSKVFVFDTSICNGCYCCQIACKDEHCGNDWTPVRQAPARDRSVLAEAARVRARHRAQGQDALRPHALQPLRRGCLHRGMPGGRAPSTSGRTAWSLSTRRSARAARAAWSACPSGAIFLNENLNIAQKCTGCAHLLDAGWNEPRCVDVCPTAGPQVPGGRRGQGTDRRSRATPSRRTEAAGLLPQRPQALHRAARCTTREAKEVVIGAACTLREQRQHLDHDHRQVRRLLVRGPGRRHL